MDPLYSERTRAPNWAEKMKTERNKEIAISVLQGMTYENVGIKYDISRERVAQNDDII